MLKTTALIVAAALGLAACGSSNDNGTGTTGSGTSRSASGGGGAYAYSPSTKSSTTAAASDDDSGKGGGEVEAYDNYFKPKTITGKAGSTVKVELKNEGKNEHNFSIESQKINKDLEAGEDATVSVKIPASGSVQFFCEYHKGLGMVGTVKPS